MKTNPKLDIDLVPENIRSWVSIYGVTGNFAGGGGIFSWGILTQWLATFIIVDPNWANVTGTPVYYHDNTQNTGYVVTGDRVHKLDDNCIIIDTFTGLNTSYQKLIIEDGFIYHKNWRNWRVYNFASKIEVWTFTLPGNLNFGMAIRDIGNNGIYGTAYNSSSSATQPWLWYKINKDATYTYIKDFWQGRNGDGLNDSFADFATSNDGAYYGYFYLVKGGEIKNWQYFNVYWATWFSNWFVYNMDTQDIIWYQTDSRTTVAPWTSELINIEEFYEKPSWSMNRNWFNNNGISRLHPTNVYSSWAIKLSDTAHLVGNGTNYQLVNSAYRVSQTLYDANLPAPAHSYWPHVRFFT
jgi:hypothetical protein